ncbi:MAG: molybdenum cofactor guanylyltransferase [Bacteroidota bacterium]
MKQPQEKFDYTAAILAGGKNTRFSGRTKAKILIDGRPVIERTIEVLEAVFSDIIIITNNASEFSAYKHIRMAGDIYHNRGPLGGLHSALSNTDKDAVFLVASDMPEISESIIRRQLSEYAISECNALLPYHRGLLEPLHAVYGKSLLKALDRYLAESDKYAIRDFLKGHKVKYFDIADIEKQNVFININTQEDLNTYLNT